VSFTAAARLGDRFGRRQTLAVLLSVSGLFTIFFGFATTVFQMLLFRTIGGFFSGGIVIIRTLFAEFSDSTNRATAFSYFSFASNIAMMAGTAVGGLLVEPDGRLTSIQLFRDFPFALPCIFAGVATIAGGVSCFIWLREPPHQEHHDLRRTIREIVNPAVLRVLLIQAFVNIFGFTYTALFPLWLFTPVKLGGLAFHPQQIGLIMVVNTLSQAIWGLVLMPRLDRRLGTRKLIAYCFYVWPVFFSIHLLESRLAQGGHRFAMWVLLLATSSLGSGVSMAFSASFDALLLMLEPAISLLPTHAERLRPVRDAQHRQRRLNDSERVTKVRQRAVLTSAHKSQDHLPGPHQFHLRYGSQSGRKPLGVVRGHRPGSCRCPLDSAVPSSAAGAHGVAETRLSKLRLAYAAVVFETKRTAANASRHMSDALRAAAAILRGLLAPEYQRSSRFRGRRHLQNAAPQPAHRRPARPPFADSERPPARPHATAAGGVDVAECAVALDHGPRLPVLDVPRTALKIKELAYIHSEVGGRLFVVVEI
jgi:MFS family permease